MSNVTLLIYRLSAFVAGIGWGVSIFATVVDGKTVFDFLQFVSGAEFSYEPMLDYWMKMAGLAFAFIGAGFLYCAFKWKESLPFGIYFGSYQLVCFLGVLLSVVRMDLNSSIYLMDCAFFLTTGIAMTLTWWKLNKTAELE